MPAQWPLTRDAILAWSALPRDELAARVRIRLENQTVMPLRDNYLDELHKLCTHAPGVDLSWLRADASGVYFVTQAGCRLDVLRADAPQALRPEGVPTQLAPAPQDASGAPEAHHIVLDQSGSMNAINDAVYAGAREVVEALPDDSMVTLTVFNHQVTRGTRMSKADALGALQTRVADGTTALRDAILSAIGMEEEEASSHTTIMVITDGLDNASRATPAQVQAAVARCNARGWRVLFLGANQDAVTTASQLGIDASRALQFDAALAPRAFRTLSENVQAYRSVGTDAFTPAQRHASMA